MVRDHSYERKKYITISAAVVVGILAGSLISGQFFSSVEAARPVKFEPLFVAETRDGNFTFNQGSTVDVPLNISNQLQSNTFAAAGNIQVYYEAECAVNAAAGNSRTWLNIDIILVNVDTNAATTLKPSVGNGDAFCTSNGTAGSDGWVRTSMTGIAENLVSGNYAVKIQADIQSGVAGDSGWLGDSVLVIRN